eukprot:3941896-Rhodomonas_salina.1
MSVTVSSALHTADANGSNHLHKHAAREGLSFLPACGLETASPAPRASHPLQSLGSFYLRVREAVACFDGGFAQLRSEQDTSTPLGPPRATSASSGAHASGGSLGTGRAGGSGQRERQCAAAGPGCSIKDVSTGPGTAEA